MREQALAVQQQAGHECEHLGVTDLRALVHTAWLPWFPTRSKRGTCPKKGERGTNISRPSGSFDPRGGLDPLRRFGEIRAARSQIQCARPQLYMRPRQLEVQPFDGSNQSRGLTPLRGHLNIGELAQFCLPHSLPEVLDFITHSSFFFFFFGGGGWTMKSGWTLLNKILFGPRL